MIHESKVLSKTIFLTSVVCFSLFGFTAVGVAGEGHQQEMTKETNGQPDTNSLPSGQRFIFGTVEGVNENTIKVDAGEAGEMSPRYLELEKLENKMDDVKEGDRLKITVNAKNKVVDYQLSNEKDKH
ncbi:MAG: hypothetical protein NPIRA04_34210 [Nitrospirales bacterium]|nr:MAG: hypothetical protein NPIRA04_34210 [Nitrospirales bacterium]